MNECSVIPAHNQCMRCDVISCAFHHARTYPKRCDLFMFISITLHVHTGIKIFASYVAIDMHS